MKADKQIEKIRRKWCARFDEEPDSWITVNGNHIPLDKDKNPIGGQMKAIGKGMSLDSLKNKVMQSKKYKELDEKRDEAWKREKALAEKLKSIPSDKPEDQWTDDERTWVKQLGRAFAPSNPEWHEVYKAKEAAFKEFNEACDKQKALLLKAEPPKHLKDFDRPTEVKDPEAKYRGFRTADTGTSISLKGAMLAEMSPKEYLERCGAMFTDCDGRKTNLTMQVRGLSRKTIDDLKEKIQSGEEMYTPWLDERGINGQEGRHRAAAAYELGIEKIPVVYWCANRKDSRL